MNLLINTSQQSQQQETKESSNPMIDGESRDLVTVGSNEDIFVPTLNHSKSSQQTFQIVNEEIDENIVHSN